MKRSPTVLGAAADLRAHDGLSALIDAVMAGPGSLPAAAGGGIDDLYRVPGIGVLLGGPFCETLRRTLLLGDGSIGALLARPAAAMLLVRNLMLIASRLPPVRRAFSRPEGGLQ
ncbi:hypothetical protein [Salipiger mangrovisoli]|uniref:Uncharacterized protein n=1 Tax=Salipiger mangrovisoli TaxID=2865933 RepID=A0ABR9XAS3_9RHOB|nr:hypothetical protein [Salipiger mangrovisoli]MBE9640719.1 hypothetical protein [Salipiger mangrovisoli]